MVIDTARRVQDQVREGLAELIRLVNDPATPTADVREVLLGSKAFGVQVSVLQADAAVVVAARERHGDSGIGLLARSAGLFRQDAAGRVRAAQSLQSMPSVRDAVEAGEVSVANAKALVRASGKTSVEQVDADAELLEKAAELSPEQFATEAGRWAIKRQDDGGENEYRRQRARRRLSFWDGDDGMVHLRGELDPVTGAKVRKRFVQESERLRRADLHSPGGDKRSLPRHAHLTRQHLLQSRRRHQRPQQHQPPPHPKQRRRPQGCRPRGCRWRARWRGRRPRRCRGRLRQ